jgi:microcystin-dependent protein
MDLYMGTIFLWALNYVPDGIMLCQGQILQTNQYQALYALIGNMYGGTAPSTFALPDLRNRFPLGLVAGNPGAHGGSFQAPVITGANLPQHIHGAAVTSTGGGTVAGSFTLNGVNDTGTEGNPGGNFLAADGTAGATPYLAPGAAQPVAMAPGSITANGVSVTMPTVSVGIQPGGGVAQPTPLTITPPYLSINYAIVVQGNWPPHP